MTDNTRKYSEMTRRLALKRLGVAAGAVYMAPVVLNLSDAKASGGGGGGGGSGGGSSGGSGGGSSGSSGGASGGSGNAGGGSGSSMSEASVPSAPSGSAGTIGTAVGNTAQAVVKVPGKIFNGVKSIFSR